MPFLQVISGGREIGFSFPLDPSPNGRAVVDPPSGRIGIVSESDSRTSLGLLAGTEVGSSLSPTRSPSCPEYVLL